MLLNDFLNNEGYGICSDIDSKKLMIYNNISGNFNHVSNIIKDKVDSIISALNKQKVEHILNLLNNDIQCNPDNLTYLELTEQELIGKFSKTFLSNLWPVNIFYKGKKFPSVEHGYMYHKFDFEYIRGYFSENPESFEEIKKSFNEKDFLSNGSQDLGLSDYFISDNIEELYFDERFRGGFIKKLSICFEKLGLRDKNWENIKLETMIGLLVEKFSTKEFMNKLLLTRGKKLVEGNDWGDTYWGIDINSKEGLNVLGRVLMILRDKIL